MRPLSILFTNNTLAVRAGSELWIRDVARALVARGHRPAAFSLVTGAVADELRAATVPIVTDLANFSTPPDLIHGHHHVETLIAALHFPGVPIVHFCHGWIPWEEKPLKHPAIVRYVAVDDTCIDRLVAEEGIPSERIDLLLNFVDLDRFAPREALPVRPQRALVLSGQAGEDGFVRVIREACRREAIDVDVAGLASGRVLDRPELALREADLVFAKARTALEALAVGCSVILADAAGAGPLVTAAQLDRLRRANFGVRLLQRPHTVSWYREQIAAYDRTDAAEVARRVRSDAGLEPAIDRLLEIYARALAESADGHAADSLGSQRAAARHLSSIAIAFKQGPAAAQRAEALTRELAAVNGLIREQAAASDRAVRKVIEQYEGLSILRLRSALMRIPVAGRAARRASRWLAERLTT